MRFFAAPLSSLLSFGRYPQSLPFASHRLRYLINPRRFCTGTLVGATTSPSAAAEDDLLRWERMYTEGSRSVGSGTVIEPSEEMTIRSKVLVVTYDLDNTLWNTSATIGAANNALAKHMANLCLRSPNNSTITRVETHMQALHKARPEDYGPTLSATSTGTTATKGPVRLTALRKDAIRRVLLDHAGYVEGDELLEEKVEEAFQVWVDARHDSIPAHFASGVLKSLRAIRELKDVVAIGAITDGNSDPMAIPELKDYFDFCIKSEHVGIGKPDRRVFQHAVELVVEQYPWLRNQISMWNEEDTTEIDTVGPWWVHIGDDFVKDVVAAKNLGMRSIWSRELVIDKVKAQSEKSDRSPTRDVETFVKEISSMDVIKMQIGDDDYLAESIQKEFADAIVDRFLGVADTIQQWQLEAEETIQINENNSQAILETTLPPLAANLKPVTDDQRQYEGSAATKFCLFCGTRLPAVAKFCSSCGEKQG